MDLRKFGLSDAQVAFGKACLAYQPFRLSDRVVTGAGYSWRHARSLIALNTPQLRFDAAQDAPDVWTKAVAAYETLERTYQAFLDVIVGACPGGSYLDVGCNTGWFPVAASLRGMAQPLGVDGWDYGASVDFLNHVTGASAAFVRSLYLPHEHRFEQSLDGRTFDIVSNLAVLVHAPDPLQMLKATAEFSRHAVFLWSAFPRSDDLLIRYAEPNQASSTPFPWGFDGGTAISDALLVLSMKALGFPNHAEILPGAGTWPTEWDNPLMAPYLPLRAFLFTRG
jgi:SAM-dependent methyltransferase